MKTIILSFRNSMKHSLFRHRLFLIPLVMACFALSPTARGVCRDGCDPSNGNTFLGDDAVVNNMTDNNTVLLNLYRFAYWLPVCHIVCRGENLGLTSVCGVENLWLR